MNQESTTRDSSFTAAGLPLDHACFGAASVADDAGPARRVDCRPAQHHLAASSLLRTPESTLKGVASKLSPPALIAFSAAPSLTVGINDSDLMDEDDEIIDYFASATTSPFSCPAPAAAASAKPSSSSWDVCDRIVPTLPSFYPVEQSAAFVPEASAPDLADRIVAVLKARSIDATFDAKNAKADCITKSNVEFRIRLYRGRGEYSHGIIVECQRRHGFDISYAQDVYAILDAAEDKKQ